MKTRPKNLSYTAIFLLFVSIGMPLQIMFLYGNTPSEFVPIAAKLAPLNWAIMLMSPLVAWLVYRASPFVVAAVPMLTYLVLANNWFVAELGTDFSPFLTGMASGAFLLGMAPLFTNSVRDLILHPERRWWFTPARRKAQLPVIIGNAGHQFVAQTYDISESGAFIQLWQIQPREPRSQLTSFEPGKIFSIFLDLKSTKRIQCRAEVVRHSRGKGSYPDGIGVRFVDMEDSERRAISEYARAAQGNSPSMAA